MRCDINNPERYNLTNLLPEPLTRGDATVDDHIVLEALREITEGGTVDLTRWRWAARDQGISRNQFFVSADRLLQRGSVYPNPYGLYDSFGVVDLDNPEQRRHQQKA